MLTQTLMPSRRVTAAAHTLLAGWLLLVTPPTAFAQLPQARLFAIHPVGGQADATIEVEVTQGDDLDGLTTLTFSHTGITAKPFMVDDEFLGKQPHDRRFVVTIDKDVPPGVYEVRAVGLYGITNARSFVVGPAAPENRQALIEQGDNHGPEKAQPLPLESAVHGRTAERTYDWYKFTAAKNQRIIIDCMAQRIDSRLDGTLVLFDSQGAEIARSTNVIGVDPLLDFTAQADGEYYIALFDALFEGGNEHVYRLSVTTGPFIDFVLPPAGEPGGKREFALYGRNLPGGSPAPEMTVEGRPLERLIVQVDVPNADSEAVQQRHIDQLARPEELEIDVFQYRLKTDQGLSNPVRIGLAHAPVVIEQEAKTQPDNPLPLTPPVEVAGTFTESGDTDWYQFQGKPGQTYMMQVISDRMGMPTDPYLLVQQVVKKDDGAVEYRDLKDDDDDTTNPGGIAFNTSTVDPVLRFDVPAEATYRVMVRNQSSSGSPRLGYRLVIREPKPDFRLVAVPVIRPTKNANNTKGFEPWSPLVMPGGTEVMNVLAYRRDGFQGPITLEVKGLPESVTAEPVIMGPGQSAAPISFHAKQDAKPWHGLIEIVGAAKLPTAQGEKDVTRIARGGEVQHQYWNNKYNGRSRATRQLVLAVGGQFPQPYDLQVDAEQPLAMSRAGKLNIPFKIIRRNGFAADVKLTALGLPGNIINANTPTIKKDKDAGVMTLDFKNNAPLGPFAFYVRAEGDYQFKRNPLALANAKKQQAKLEEVTGELTKAAREADEKRKEADKGDNAEAKTKARQIADQAAAKLKRAQAALKKVSDEVNKIEKDKPDKIKVYASSQVIQLDIKPTPVNLTVQGDQPVIVKQGAEAEVKIKVDRLFGFADEVNVELVRPGNVAGIAFKGNRVKVAKDDAQPTLTLTAAKDATPGAHTLRIKQTVKFNNQNLTQETPIRITIEKAEAAEAKKGGKK